MTPLIKAKIKEFEEKFFMGKFHREKIHEAETWFRQALTEVQEAQKRSDVAILENFKFPKSSHSCEWKTALDEAITKIQG